MKLQSFTLLLVLSFFPTNKSVKLFNTKLVVDFLNQFTVNVAIVFHCDTFNEVIEDLISIARNEFVYLSFFDISSRAFNSTNSWLLMKYENRQLGVIFDIDCNGKSEAFDECSRSNYFNASYQWLMLSQDYKSSITILKLQNINLDAEITLAVKAEREEIQLFDVYNTNSRTNGELVVLPKGTWIESLGMNISLNGSKFERRSNLNGAVVLAGVVASGIPTNQTLQQYMESKYSLYI